MLSILPAISGGDEDCAFTAAFGMRASPAPAASNFFVNAPHGTHIGNEGPTTGSCDAGTNSRSTRRPDPLPMRIRNLPNAVGFKAVGDIRETTDAALLSLLELGRLSVRYVRETLGLPSTDGVGHGALQTHQLPMTNAPFDRFRSYAADKHIRCHACFNDRARRAEPHLAFYRAAGCVSVIRLSSFAQQQGVCARLRNERSGSNDHGRPWDSFHISAAVDVDKRFSGLMLSTANGASSDRK
jgi:hypothetical protein